MDNILTHESTIALLSSKNRAFIQDEKRLLIDGRWCASASGKNFETYDPSTGEILARCAEGDQEDVRLAVAAARKAFESGPWPKVTASERGRLIWKIGDLMLEMRLKEQSIALMRVPFGDDGKTLGPGFEWVE